MKNSILCLFFFFAFHCGAQNWQWSKKTKPPVYSWWGQSKLLTDAQGNIYSYGSYNNSSTDTIGSYIQCYSPNGILIYSKRWQIPFHIQKMEYDGNKYFYFAAGFFGLQTIDGINIISKGSSDGVIGKMDLNGNVIWMKTFGGPGPDLANGLCLKSSDSTVFVIGGIKDSLYFNNNFHSINPRSAIILQYSSSGNLLTNRLYHIQSQNFGASDCGIEICRNHSGDLYALMDLNGDKWWGNEAGSGYYVGRYLLKLDANLDTLWSQRVNGPQSYYGWSCNNLKVSAGGDAYITNEFSGKYGGQAYLQRFDRNTGVKTWSMANGDGIYTDAFIDSNMVYVIGNEGANGCPCPGNNPGYYVIKKIDMNNNVLGETRVHAAHLNGITKSANSIFVIGAFNGSSCTLGPDFIYSDSTLTSYGYYQYTGNFLSKLGDVNCAAPVISVVAPSIYGHFYTLCPGDSAALSVNLTSGIFNWSNGSSGTNINVGTTGNYFVSNVQPNGCVAYSLPVRVIVNQNINSHKICMVTYNDSLHKNRVAVRADDSNYSSDITQISLFKQQGSSMIPISSNSTEHVSWGVVFTDDTSNPDSTSVEYYISTTDSCGTQSNLSLVHQSMFLTVARVNDHHILNWNAYVGMPITTYRIWRGTSPINLVLYDSVGMGQTTYTDLNSPPGQFYYQVQTNSQQYGCVFDGKYYRASRSNIGTESNSQVGLFALSSNSYFDIYPNPSKGIIQIDYQSLEKEKIGLNIFNIQGEKIYSESLSKTTDKLSKQINLSNEATGIYFLELTSGNKREVKKIVVN